MDEIKKDVTTQPNANNLNGQGLNSTAQGNIGQTPMSGQTVSPTGSNIDQAANNPATNGMLGGNQEMISKINEMYDANLRSQQAGLDASYQRALGDAQMARDNINTQYADAKNQLSAQYEKNKRNLNYQANINGLNTGAGSQMQLAQNANYLSNASKLARAQAQSIANADKNINDITYDYQQQVNQAIAKNDYQKAAALLDEYNNNRSQMQNNAKILASYGDFSMYSQLFGEDVAKNMENVWRMQNPDMAFHTGKMSAEEYKGITGKYPVGYNVASGGGYGGGGGGTPLTPTEPTKLTWAEVLNGVTSEYKNTTDRNSVKTDVNVNDKLTNTEKNAINNNLKGVNLTEYYRKLGY